MKIGVSKGQRVCKEKEQLDQLLSVKVERLLGIWNKQKMGKKKIQGNQTAQYVPIKELKFSCL